MLKYKIVYVDKVDGKTERVVECDFVALPSVDQPMIRFGKNPTDIVLAVNPASIHQAELLEGELTEQPDGKLVDKADVAVENVWSKDPLSSEGFGHEE